MPYIFILGADKLQRNQFSYHKEKLQEYLLLTRQQQHITHLKMDYNNKHSPQYAPTFFSHYTQRSQN